MEELIFNEENHTYKYCNCIIPSVTEILSILSDEIYGKLDINTIKKASEKGSKVHYQTEMYDLYKLLEYDEETEGYMKAYLKFLEDYKPEVLMVEQKVYHRKMLYAGTLDRLYRINGVNVLVDIKTTSRTYEKLVMLQNTAYAMCVDLLFPQYKVDDLAILHLKNDGTYEFKFVPRREDLFITIYKTYNMKKTLLED